MIDEITENCRYCHRYYCESDDDFCCDDYLECDEFPLYNEDDTEDD